MGRTPRIRTGWRSRKSSCDVPSVLFVGEDGDRGDCGRPADIVGQRDSRTVDLILGLAAELVEQFVALRDAGCSRRMPLGLQTPARVDRHRSSDVMLAALDQLVGLEPLDEAEVLVTDQLDSGEAV